jgi:hypothetical protein
MADAVATGATMPPAEGGSKRDQGAESNDGGKEKGVGKSAGSPFAKRGRWRLKPLTIARAVPRRSIRALTKAVANGLRDVASEVANQVRRRFSKLAKDDDPDPDLTADEIVSSIDLDGLVTLIGPTEKELAVVMTDTSTAFLAQLGVSAEDQLVDRVNEAAVEFARNRAAEMVGRRYDKNGDLIEARNAEYRIDDSTRDMLRATIADGLQENVGLDEIVDRIVKSYAFSDERAEVIARTEISRANAAASLLGAKSARDGLDLTVRKLWLTAQDDLVCEDICAANEDQGLLELDETFQSGDDAPPGHPRCRCTITYEVSDQPEQQDDD